MYAYINDTASSNNNDDHTVFICISLNINFIINIQKYNLNIYK